eukprot:GGOE01033268.1.p1 GENE.GGOE01033268.1~~GGOE01033268.1.p1  ORF type:complete len:1200 (+),score=423.33 GGOE01033268.1:84-3602(+)
MGPVALPNSLVTVGPSAEDPVSPAVASSGPRAASSAGVTAEGATLTSLDMEMLAEEEEEFTAVEDGGVEMLRRVFDSMATNGRVTMDQLPFVLVGAEVHATAQEINEAIDEQMPDADDADALLDFDHVLSLYQHLLHATDIAQLEHDTAQAVAFGGPSLWQRFRDWTRLQLQRRKLKQTAYEKHTKPTTRLLFLILAASCAVSISLVVFAVVLIFDRSDNLVVTHIKRDGELMKDGLQLFGYEHVVQTYNRKLTRLATMLGVVVDQLGYQNAKRTQKTELAYQRVLLSNLLDEWYSHDSLSMVNASVTVTKGWIDQLVAHNGTLADVVQMVDKVNARMPTGHEILLACWNATANRIDFLTTFRFKCLGVCASDQVHGSTATRLAIAGQSGTLFGYDYRPMPVIAAYTPLTSLGLALVYNVQQTQMRADFNEAVSEVVNDINAWSATRENLTDPTIRQNTQEIVLANNESGTIQIMTTMQDCNSACLAEASVDGMVIASAVAGLNGTAETDDFNGESTLCAYGPMVRAGIGMEVKLTREEFLDDFFTDLGKSLNYLNGQLSSSMEVEFCATAKTNTTTKVAGLRCFTTWLFQDECGTACGTFAGNLEYLKYAINNKVSGVTDGLDYRNVNVTAGYVSFSAYDAALSLKVSKSQIIKDGAAMTGVIATFQNNVRYAGKSTEVMVGRKKPGVAVAHSARDFDRIAVLKHRDQCPNLTCTGPSTHMVPAVNGHTGYARGPDYRYVDGMGAYTYLPMLDVGMVVKIDVSEAEERSFMLTGMLCGCSIGAVIVGTLLLALLTHVLLRSIDRAWDEGKQAVEREKHAFRTVIEAMYPAQVATRMLAGEKQIVYNIPSATVFFSDIYEFTTTSNSVSPHELIQFLGYTFGVMDAVGEYYHVHKVKTIGDAYLAVTGLPGLDSLNGSTALDMLLFASCCNQIFSNRFLHPAEADILDMVVRNVLAQKAPSALGQATKLTSASQLAQIPDRPALISYGDPKEAVQAGVVDEEGVPPVHCIMRYGLSLGPITAGVLQGRLPLFDIWGPTVNLASRMESTGQAGRIQVVEGVFQAVVAQNDQPFLFDSRHKVFCKGFGSVNAYFVAACSTSPPKELLAALHIEPNLGAFFFDNPVPEYRPRVKGGVLSSGKSGSQRSSSVGQQSAQSSATSNVAANVRGPAQLA